VPRGYRATKSLFLFNEVANINFKLFIHLPDVERNFRALGKISINICSIEKPKPIEVNVKNINKLLC
jgi:hypothetical protein